MALELVRLAYVSTLQPRIDASDLTELIEKAAAFNKTQDITGVLAIEGHRICQILEGPSDSVKKLYASIQKDSRHHGVTTIENRPIAKTAFESWGMAKRNMVDMVVYALTT
ncbi:hypothetical protein ASD50_01195 [Mesorhizobium sp. Root552]|jgi:hypothetical protein|uniref:BLUF domain-containing protein n=1 Tax=Mesorhizobium sp. Root552 TaxID=1736555 RepID=UPI0006FDF6A9|nr:BLUF domain-containing protein [Mesorhizobium sp. Root552]KQZ33428.1 hypothetical protein ASD50_01195 [Mesorhizobium sp. Root552]